MTQNSDDLIQKTYLLAKEAYAAQNIDTDAALKQIEKIAISLHCWQGDDVRGFENPDAELTGGLAATGNYPGRARKAEELRKDLDLAFSLIPGYHRLNLHAIYLEAGKHVDRNEIQPEHFSGWVDWAKENEHGLDFNPTCFSHPLADSGFTLSHQDPAVRQFWIEHCIASRKIGAHFGQALGTPAVTNIWIPDGYKDTPFDRLAPRERLLNSLDQILAVKINPQYNLDAVEPKLFGIGSESYVTGSMEFYLGYAISRKILLTLDSGHFHPTESVADKISSVLLYLDRLLLHVSRGVRWDSDHVVTFTDDLRRIAQQVVRNDYLSRVHIGLDYFDASINRIAAWVIGSRNTLKAFLAALLEPKDALYEAERSGDYTQRLAILESLKSLPLGSIWDFYCLTQDVPLDLDFMMEIRGYEQRELSLRG